MTRQELIGRILWVVDGYRYDYVSRADLINRLTDLIDNHTEAL